MHDDSSYQKEKSFLNRRARRTDVVWEFRPGPQLISQAMDTAKANALRNDLKAALEVRTGSLVFEQMVKIVAPKTGGSRVVVSVNLLREKFAAEIEGGDVGGGGRGYNPLRTTPTRGGR